MIDTNSILRMLASQQGRPQLSPEEEELLRMQQEQQTTAQREPMERIMLAQNNPADSLAQSPGSTANALMRRRQAIEGVGLEPGDMVPQRANPGGYAARTGTRRKQSSSQEEQLVRMLVGRGMSEEEARARARGMQ